MKSKCNNKHFIRDKKYFVIDPNIQIFGRHPLCDCAAV